MTFDRSEFITRWVEALRSGEYKQCRNRLHDKDGGYCFSAWPKNCSVAKTAGWKRKTSLSGSATLSS